MGASAFLCRLHRMSVTLRIALMGIGVKHSPMFIRAFAFLLLLAPVVLAQEPTPIVSDPKLTPGDAFDVKVQDLGVPDTLKRCVAFQQMKREVYEEYGITSHESGDYEVDHLVPLELGGSNSIKNLWPKCHRTSANTRSVLDGSQSAPGDRGSSRRFEMCQISVFRCPSSASSSIRAFRREYNESNQATSSGSSG
jgi:hypothetical protein